MPEARTMLRPCPSCATIVSASLAACPNCGASLVDALTAGVLAARRLADTGEAELELGLHRLQAGDHRRACRLFRQAFLSLQTDRARALDALDAALRSGAPEAALLDDEAWWAQATGPERDTTERARLLALRVAAKVSGSGADAAIERAREVPPALAAAVWPRLQQAVATMPLPDALAPRSGHRHWLLARLAHALALGPEALAEADATLEAGLTETPAYEEAPVHALRGELLVAAGDTDEAAAAFRESGLFYHWRHEPLLAIAPLTRAFELAPGEADTWWSLADAHVSASYGEHLAPEDQREHVTAAQRLWSEASARFTIGPSDAWAYAVAAYLAVRAAQIETTLDSVEAQWQAIACIERALLLAPSDASRWGNLAEFHHGLQNLHNMVDAARHHAAIAPTQWLPHENLLVGYSNSGRWDEALAELEKIRALEDAPRHPGWIAAVEARLLLYTGRPAEALPSMDRAIQEEPERIGHHAVRSWVRLSAGQFDGAREDLQQVIALPTLGDPDLGIDQAHAQLLLGDPDAAMAILQPLLEPSARPGLTAFRAKVAAALVDLVRSPEPAAIDRLAAEIDRRFDRESLWEVAQILRMLARLQPEFASRADAGLQVVAQARPSTAADARAELAAALEGAPSPARQAGALAGLARLDLDAGRAEDALRRYHALAAPALAFPEAGQGIARATAAWFDGLTPADWAARLVPGTAPEPWLQDLLAQYPTRRLGLAADAGSTSWRIVPTTQIEIGVARSLAPEGSVWQWPLMTTLLPDLSAQFAAEFAIDLPEVQPWLDSTGVLGPGGVEIRIGETPVWFGTVDAGDAQADIVRHLDPVLRRHLSRFVDIDAVADWLARELPDGEYAPIVERWLADDEALLRLTRLRRTMAQEQLPLRDAGAWIALVHDLGLEDLPGLLRAVRLALRGSLPGQADGTRLIDLSESGEALALSHLMPARGGPFLALPPSDAQDLLSEVRAQVGEADGPAALRVHSDLLRPCLRQLIELDFEQLPLLSQAETAARPEGPP
jgi:tetratricopeptide (TPR) repeat protein